MTMRRVLEPVIEDEQIQVFVAGIALSGYVRG